MHKAIDLSNLLNRLTNAKRTKVANTIVRVTSIPIKAKCSPKGKADTALQKSSKKFIAKLLPLFKVLKRVFMLFSKHKHI